MAEALVIVGSILTALGLLVLSVTSIRYHLTPPFLKVTWMGLPVRRIRLDQIQHITTRPVFWSERWHNTLLVRNRLLVLRRTSGWLFKNISITPRNHFVFKADLERAQRGSSPSTSPSPSEFGPSTLDPGAGWSEAAWPGRIAGARVEPRGAR